MKKYDELSIKDIVTTSTAKEDKYNKKSVASWLWLDNSDYVSSVSDTGTDVKEDK